MQATGIEKPVSKRVPVGRWKRLFPIAIAAAAIVAFVVIGRVGGAYLPALASWVSGQGVLGPVVFIAVYAVATVALVPGSLLTLAAGAVFGLAAGVAYVFAGAVLGATLAFLVARYAARTAVERRIRGDPRFERIDAAIARSGRKIVFLLRLSPVLPFNLLNYALGLTRVRLRDYVIASLGMLPGTFLYVYTGRVAGDVASLAGGAAVERGPEYYAVLVLGLVATAAVTIMVTRIARRALRKETNDDVVADA
jgi:uncharacterized membrane protein YdjX (TVP38/TMEM64 family)